MPAEWPKSIDEIFEGTTIPSPTNIDAALKWTNNKSYIFTGSTYYKLTGWRVMKVCNIIFDIKLKV
jgi:hypothetical protein